MVAIIFFLLLWVGPLLSIENNNSWTWLYRKTFSQKVRRENERKTFLMFSKENVSPYTQLVFSWNAFRPETGYYSFYVQVRDAKTKNWGSWHHMIDWGKNIQRSYHSKSDGFSSYVHVRLEVEKKKIADAFRVKIKSHEGAHLQLLHGFSVALSNFNMFTPEFHEKAKELSSVSVSDVPSIAQFALHHEDSSRMCSPASCTMVARYLTGRKIDPLDFAQGVFDEGLNIYGSWPFNSAHAFEHCDGKAHFFVRRFNSFGELHKQLIRGIPVVVSVRGELPGAFKPFPHGHLLVVVGWDSKTHEVICKDPASDNNKYVSKRYPVKYFLQAWEKSHRLAYMAEPIVKQF